MVPRGEGFGAARIGDAGHPVHSRQFPLVGFLRMRPLVELQRRHSDRLTYVRAVSISLVLGLLMAGCSSVSDEATASTEDRPAISVSSSTSMTSLPTTVNSAGETTTSSTSISTTMALVDNESIIGLGVIEFIEGLGDLLAGTPYQEALLEDPEVFVATGLLFCERIGNGTNPIDLLSEYIATVHDGDPADAPPELLDLSGWVLGVAVGYLCPQHADLVRGIDP